MLADGGRIRFDRVSGTTFSNGVTQNNSTPGRYFGGQIVLDNNASQWVLTLKNGTVMRFRESGLATLPQAAALQSITDRYGNTLTCARDSSFNLTKITSPNGCWISFTYDTSNRVTLATDNIGRTVQYSYDASGRLNQVTDANGGIWKYGYYASNNMTTITDARNIQYLQTFYDANERVFKQIQADNGTYLYSYTVDANNNITQTTVTDPLGNVRQVNFGPPLVSVGATLGYGFPYQTGGYSSTETFALGKPEQQTFSYQRDPGNNQLLSVTDPLGRTVARILDEAGRVTGVINPFGQISKFVYNPLNQITTATDPLGNQTGFGFDLNGNRQSVTDANNHTTQYSYDNMDRVATRKDPLQNQESYQYDGNGNVTQFTDRRGKVSTYTYDGLNRIAFVGFGTQAGPTYESTVTYTFDAGNRLTKAVDSISGTITRGYDGLDRLASDTTPQGAVSYTYDTAGRRASLTVPGQSVANYTFDNANRLMQITQGSTVVSFGYDNANRRTTLTLPNGIVTSYSYDTASQLAGIVYQSGSAVLGNLAYGYDLAGRRVSMGGSFARTGLPLAVTQTAYNANNQLTTWGTANLFYDMNGNMTSDGTHSYTWDSRNHLTQVDAGNTASFVYDPFGRRTSKTILGAQTSFLYDGANPVQELSGTTATANLLTGSLDEYFTRTDSARATSFLTDALGSTLALTDSTGTVQTSYTFEPFGNTTQGGSSTTNSFAYTGREFDTSNLYYYRARHYSPSMQRFISEDPIGFRGGVNKYSYVLNSPVNFVDALGLEKRKRCPGEVQSGLLSAFLNVATLGVPGAAAGLSGHVVTVGYDANLAASFGTFGISAHAGDALALDPHGNIALISTTGTGAGFGGDVGIGGQGGFLRATSVFDLEPVSRSVNTTVAAGEGLQGSVGVDTEGNVTVGLGVGEGVVTSGTIDETTVKIIACPQ